MNSAPEPFPTAPVPQLGAPAIADAAAQPWSSGVRIDALLVARFGFEPAEFRRCWLRILRQQLPILAVGSTLCGLCMPTIVVVSVAIAPAVTHRPVPAPILQKVVMFALRSSFGSALILFMMMAATFYLQIWASSLLKLFLPAKPPTVFVADAAGVRYGLDAAPVPFFGLRTATPRLRWAQVARVLLHDSDVFVLPKAAGMALYAPRSAFAGADAAARFADAVTALWKAHGDPSALDEAALQEFR